VGDHLVAPPPAEVEIDVGAILARRIQEALEGQLVAQRIGIGQLEAIGHQAVRRRSASHVRDALGAGEVGDPLHQEEVGRVTQLVDGRELVVQPPHDLGPQRNVTPTRAVEREPAQARVSGLVLAELDPRKEYAAERGQVGARLGHLERPPERARNIREERLHLRRGQEVPRTLRQPWRGEVAAQRVVLDRDPHAMMRVALGPRPVHVGHRQRREPDGAGRGHELLRRYRLARGRDLRRIEQLDASVLRDPFTRAASAPLLQGRRRDRHAELLRRQASAEREDQARMIDEEEESVPET